MYQINPIDNFFFRSSVPFECSGETSLIGNTFPPFPSTYAGALKPFKTEKRIRVGFNGIAINNEIYLPKPLDLMSYKQGSEIFCRGMELVSSPLSSFPLPYLLATRTENASKDKSFDDLYINYNDFTRYQNGVEADFKCIRLSDYIIKEPKIGIAIDKDSNTAKDEQLYQIQMLRPDKGLKIICDVKNTAINEEVVVRLGGESRMAKISPFDVELNDSLNTTNSSYFKLYLATPAIFKNGWLPAWIDPDTYTGRFSFKDKSIAVSLISATIGKKLPIGGYGYDLTFDSNKTEKRISKPKEMRYAVPAGSVYYFKITNGSFQNAKSLFNQKCISDYREDYGFDYPEKQYNRIKYCDRGFGYAIVGKLINLGT